VVASSPNGPVADFCAALRELQVSAGISRTTLARQVNYGRSQLYDILDGRIRRPPEWDRLVEPLLRTCLRDRPDLELTVADWRMRYEVLLRVHDELSRRAGRATGPADAGPSTSQVLIAHSARLWPRLTTHPFVQAVGQGRLSDAEFRWWLVNDHYFNVEYQRFIAGVAGMAPNDATTETIATALSDARLGLTEIRRLAERFAVDLDAEPGPATVALAAYLQSQVSHGYEPALGGFYASERVYLDAWSAVRPHADRGTPYWPLIDSWSSRSYEIWLGCLGRLVDATAPSTEMLRTFDRTVRFELLFMDGLHTRAGW
jgi:thiaminase